MKQNYIVNGFELDTYQMNLLLHNNNALVIAGAGSGKTLTILGKINYLIEKQNINPEEILVISFTNTSVNDLKKRTKYNVNIYTFHKLAIYILNKNYVNYSIVNSNLLVYIITEYFKTCCKKEQNIILNFFEINLPYEVFLKSQYFVNCRSLIVSFINLFKTNNLNYQNIFSINYTNKEKKILIIIFKIYKIYLTEKLASQKLDFDDLINCATYYASKTKLNFKYIIIDEFQDTSAIRLNLIKEIYESEKAKIIVVGDDWQSIYHFSGCDLNIFLNFSNYFKNVLNIQLLNTYRNSQELIDIASKFVQKNPNQIKKNLISSKHNYPIVFVPYRNQYFMFKKILDYLLTISKDILILSRNNNDIYKYIDNDIIYNNGFVFYKNYTIPYLTIHKSKGLEAEYTIILNCNNETLGFPNKIENNKIIDKLFSKENIPFSEERRLFYVALTRCKEKTFILYDKKNPSNFIKELKKIVITTLGKISYFK